MPLPYKIVDVFTERPLLGNPVAVVFDAEDLDAGAMQALARWTNLSETTFVLPPTVTGADYRLRIFSPRSELPFAGHPSLGSAFAALEAGRVSPDARGLVQECAAGLIALTVEEDPSGRRVALKLPEARVRDLTGEETADLQAALGAPLEPSVGPAIVDLGPRWITAELLDAQAVLDLEPDLGRIAALERRLGATGVTVFGRQAPEAGTRFEVRSFAPSDGVPEDPVCGSGNGAVAVLARRRGRLPPEGLAYRASQGRRVGRKGVVEIEVDADGGATLGGRCVTVGEGLLRL